MPTLLLALGPALAAAPLPRPPDDQDAACGWASLQVAVSVERAYEQAFDAYLDALAPLTDLPIPEACAGRVSTYVTSVSATTFEACSRVTSGVGAGRTFCAHPTGEVYEKAGRTWADPAEASSGYPEGMAAVYEAAARLLPYPLGPDDAAPGVVVGVDGRVVARLDASRTRTCALTALRGLVRAEQSYDAAFDTYSADYDALGYRLELLGSCPAYVGVRVAAVAAGSVDLEAAILEGRLAGSAFAATQALAPHPIDPIVVDRATLAAEGWLMGEAPP